MGRPPAIRAAADAAFGSWTQAYTTVFESAGLAADTARPLATFVVTAIEGAVLLARATHSLQPLRNCGNQLDLLLVAHLQGAVRS
ncbi:LmrA/YxaF family transcription factor [Nocardia suismassiliense]|uniref:LmrA/YxaF family transcription factor n=1 Tax=Nocardia suismassiliense TaxID=2077092 RepID=UPI0018FE5DAC|nr:hypothetical protein [Nocardia suismassiliense]